VRYLLDEHINPLLRCELLRAAPDLEAWIIKDQQRALMLVVDVDDMRAGGQQTILLTRRAAGDCRAARVGVRPPGSIR